MTAPEEIEPEFLAPGEDDDRLIPIENSHLSEGRCACGSVALVAPGRRPRCGKCLRADADTGSGIAPEPVAGILPLGQGDPPLPPEGRAPYPLPEVSSRDAWDGKGAPNAFTAAVEKARAAGWRVKVQRSRGCPPHASTGHPGAIRDFYALRATIGTHSAYAIQEAEPCPVGCTETKTVTRQKVKVQIPHVGGSGQFHDAKWSSVMVWSAAEAWFPGCSITDLHEYFRTAGAVPAGWRDEIRNRLAGQEERKAELLLCNRGAHPMKYRSQVGPEMSCSRCGNSWPARGEPWRKPKVKKTEAN